MDPNSLNQRWSKWVFTIFPGGRKHPQFSVIEANAARFGRRHFGSASQMRVTCEERGRVRIEVRSEGHPVHDVAYVEWMSTLWRLWAMTGWGVGTTVTCESKLEAGSRQDGTPPDQLIIGPPMHLRPRL